MTDLTPERLAELKALEKAATPGDWYWTGNWNSLDAPGDNHIIWPANSIYDSETAKESMGACGRDCEANASNNAALIAALRNAAPALIAAAEERDELRNLPLHIVSQSDELDRLRALLVEAGEAMERRKAFKEEAYSNKDVFDCAVATIDFEFDLLFAEIRRATQTQEPKP